MVKKSLVWISRTKTSLTLDRISAQWDLLGENQTEESFTGVVRRQKTLDRHGNETRRSEIICDVCCV